QLVKIEQAIQRETRRPPRHIEAPRVTAEPDKYASDANAASARIAVLVAAAHLVRVDHLVHLDRDVDRWVNGQRSDVHGWTLSSARNPAGTTRPHLSRTGTASCSASPPGLEPNKATCTVFSSIS